MKLVVMNQAVYTFKLNSGEELIAKVIDTHDGHVTIDTPVSVAPGPQGLGLVPSLFTADPEEKVKINISSISMYTLTDESVKTKYIEATTGIRIPDKKIVMG